MSDSNDPYKKVVDLGYAGAGTAGSLATNLATFAPIAIGSYYGFNRLTSNKDYAVRGLATGSMRQVNTNVGQNLEKLRQARDTYNAKKSKELRSSLLEGSNIKNILSESAEKRKALIGSVLEIIDDPGANTNIEALTSLRDKIVKLLETDGTNAAEDEEKIIKNILTTVLDSGTSSSKERFKEFYQRLNNYGSVLQAPTSVNINGLKPKFNEIDVSALQANSPARANFDKLQQLIGDDSSLAVKIMKGNITGSTDDVFEAHLFTKSGKEKLRIRLNSARIAGGNIVRTAQGTTTALIKRKYLSANQVLNLMQEANDTFLEQTSKGGRPDRNRIMQDLLRDKGGDFFDYQFHVLKKMKEDRGLIGIKSKDFYAALSEVTDQASRSTRIASVDPEFYSFSKGFSSVTSNQMIVYGMENLSKREQQTFVPTVTSSFPEIFDPAGLGTDPVRRTEQGTAYTGFSSTRQGTLSNLRGFGNFGINRNIQPITAREQQFIGRKTMFIDSNAAINKVASTLKMNTANSIDLAFEFNDISKQGRAHRIAILDVNDNALARLGLGEGEAYMGGLQDLRVRQELTKTSVDLEQMKRAAPALYNELVEAQKAGRRMIIGDGASYEMITGDKRKLNNIDDFFNVFGIKGGGAAFSLSEGEVSIPRYQGMTRLNIGLVEATEIQSKNRTLVHLAGTYDVISPFAKVFGSMFKGTVKDLTGTVESNLPQYMQVAKSVAPSVERESLMLAEGAMLKKSSAYLAYQMIGGAAVVGQTDVNKFFNTVTRNLQVPTTAQQAEYTTSFKTQLASNIARELVGNQSATDENIGRVFAGYLKYSSTEDDLKNLLTGAGYSDTRVGNILTSAKQGYAVALSSSIAGPQSSTLVDNLASMEPRVYKFLQYRMQNLLGMGVDEASDVMIFFVARFGGIGENLKTLQSLEMMATSIGPGASISDARYRNLERVGIQEFIEAKGGAGMAEFLSSSRFSNGNGFMLSLDESSARAFGKKEIFIAGGKEIVDNLPNIILPTGEGKEVLENEYIRRVEQLSNDLESLKNISTRGSAQEVQQAQTVVKSFIKDYSDIFGGAFRQLLRGRMRGSTMAQGGGFILSSFDDAGNVIAQGSAEFTVAQHLRIAKAVKESASPLMRSGAYAMADTSQFLTAMKTFMSGETDSLIATEGMSFTQAQKAASEDAANLTARFFLGMEGKQSMGATMLIGRHPVLAATHITPLEVIRNVAETGQQDVIFKKFTETQEGEKALKQLSENLNVKISSFADISHQYGEGNRGVINKFFGSMLDNVSNFMSGEGGGRLLFPSMLTDVHFNGKKRTMDLSLASGMIGDFDGDVYQLMMPTRKLRKSLSSQATTDALTNDLTGRILTRFFVEETKSGISNYAKGLSGGDGIEMGQFLLEESQKEIYAKDVGQLDTSLDKLRMGIAAQTYDNNKVFGAQGAMSLLTALEEISLKSKKAARAIPIAEELTNAMNLFLNTKGESQEALDRVLNKILQGTDIGSANTLNEGKAVIGDLAMEGSSRDFNKVLGSLQGKEINLGEILDVFRSGAVAANQIGAEAQKNASTMAMAMTRADRQAAYMAAVQGGSPQGAMMMGARQAGGDELDVTLTKLMSAFERASNYGDSIATASNASFKKALGPIAGGLAASLAMNTIFGNDGYSPEPMVMPGEFSDARVNASIMTGAVTQGNISPDSLPEYSNPMDMNGRTLNSGNLSIQRTSAYSMKGEVVNYASVGDTMNLVNRLGSNGTFIINDHRRPMSRHYMERVFGD